MSKQLLLGVSALSIISLNAPPPAVASENAPQDSPATEKPAKKKKENAESSTDKTAPVVSTELDGATLKFVNQGNWKGAADRLEKQTASAKGVTRNHAWLGFAYMFLNDNAKLKKLAEKVHAETTSGDAAGYVTIIDAFNQVLEGKPDAAEKTLAVMPSSFANDALANFALAAVAGKQGKAAQAVEYCKKSVAEDPKFAWGYRTLGYLQLRWLQLNDEAEKSLQEALRLEPSQGEVREMVINEKLARNDFDGAIDIALAGIKANPKDGKAHYRLAQIYIQQWRLREALTELQNAITVDPDTPSYYRTRATIRKYQGDFPDAIADQKKAVELSKDKPFELIELANTYTQQGDTAGAIATLNEAIKLDPSSKGAHKALAAILLKEKRFDDLINEYKASIKNQPKDASLHFSLAEILHTLGNDEEAIEHYKEAANLDVKDPRPYRRLGAIYLGRREYKNAENAYSHALAINTSPSVQDLVGLGYSYTQLENYQKAEAGFITALAVQQLMGSGPDDPKREDIIRSLASLLIVEGRYDEAKKQFESLYALTRETDKGVSDKYLLQQAKLLSDRSDASAKELIAGFDTLPKASQEPLRYTLVQSLLKAGKPDFANEVMTKVAEETMSADQRWALLKARTMRLKGDFEKATSTIDDAIKLASQGGDEKQVLVAEMLLEKARILNEAGKLKEAEQAANDALQKYDRVYASYLVLGQIKLKQNETDAALDFAKKALEQNQYFTDAYILTGDAYLKKGKPKEAVDSFKMAIEIYPGLLNAHKALLRGYKALALNDEAKKEEEQISRMEKTN